MYRMKHTLILVAAALVLTACSQDEPAGNSLPGGKYPLELTAANLHEAVAIPAVTTRRDRNSEHGGRQLGGCPFGSRASGR